MPEKIYHEDEVIVSQEDVDTYYVPAIFGNIVIVWEKSTLPEKDFLPWEGIMIDLMEIIRKIYRDDENYPQYDDLRKGIVKKLRQCVEQLHKTGSLPEDCKQ